VRAIERLRGSGRSVRDDARRRRPAVGRPRSGSTRRRTRHRGRRPPRARAPATRRSVRSRGLPRASAEYRSHDPDEAVRPGASIGRRVGGGGSATSKTSQPATEVRWRESRRQAHPGPARRRPPAPDGIARPDPRSEPDIEVAGIASTVEEAKALARERMDVVLMDYKLPDGTVPTRPGRSRRAGRPRGW
jgi:hypothetical protein